MKYIIQKNNTQVISFVRINHEDNTFDLLLSPAGATVFQTKKEANNELTKNIPNPEYYSIVNQNDAIADFEKSLANHIVYQEKRNLIDHSFLTYNEDTMSDKDVLKFFVDYSTNTMKKGDDFMPYEVFKSYPKLFSTFDYIYEITQYSIFHENVFKIVPKLSFPKKDKQSFDKFKSEIQLLINSISDNDFFQQELHLVNFQFEGHSEPYLVINVVDNNTLMVDNKTYSLEEFFNRYKKEPQYIF
tara:strand:- start:42814 stop:43545 length:732 start_codon:yes stop_codon:yes gene_type:complete